VKLGRWTVSHGNQTGCAASSIEFSSKAGGHGVAVLAAKIVRAANQRRQPGIVVAQLLEHVGGLDGCRKGVAERNGI
jgi:hypothetical protein